MMMNKLRGTVADRPIDARVIRDESAVQPQATVQRTPLPTFEYQLQMSPPAAVSRFGRPADTLLGRLRSVLDRLDSFGVDIHIGEVAVYEKG